MGFNEITANKSCYLRSGGIWARAARPPTTTCASMWPSIAQLTGCLLQNITVLVIADHSSLKPHFS